MHNLGSTDVFMASGCEGYWDCDRQSVASPLSQALDVFGPQPEPVILTPHTARYVA